MTKKVIYFTKGTTVTKAEQQAIDAMLTHTEQPYDVLVVNGNAPAEYDGNLIEADYVSGYVPLPYSGYTEIDPYSLGDYVTEGQLETILEGYSQTNHKHDASDIISGTISIDRLPASVVERLVIVADEAARFALTLAQVQNGDVVKQNDDGALFFVKDDTQLSIEAGYEPFSVGSAGSVPWSGVTGKPTEFPPEAHQHAISDVQFLEGALAGKAPTVHGHAIADVDGLSTALAGKAASSHTHDTGDVEGLGTALAGKADSEHTHEIADVSGLSAALSAGDFPNGVLLGNIEGAVGTPAAGKTTIFSYGFSTDSAIPSYKLSNGMDRMLEDLQGLKVSVRWDTLSAGSSSSASNTGSPTNLGTTSVGWNTSGTNSKTRMRAINHLTTNSTAAQICGQSYGASQAFITCGNGAGLGGFRFCARFAFNDSNAGARAFIGLTSASGSPTIVEPSTIGNCLGVAQLSTDGTQLYIVSGGSAPITPIPLGSTNFPAGDAGVAYDFMIYSEPYIYGKLFWYIRNKQNGAVSKGSIDGGPVNVPGSSVFMYPKLWRASAASGGGQVASLLISHVSIEVD